MNYKKIIVLIMVGMLLLPNYIFANESIKVSMEVPYSVTNKNNRVIVGQGAQLFLVLENYGNAKENVEVSLEFPQKCSPIGQNENWQLYEGAGGTILSCKLNLSAEYCQWFDLVGFKVDNQVTPGNYEIKAIVNGAHFVYNLEIVADESNSPRQIEIVSIGLPQDEDGIRDKRFEINSLVLRDETWDYYKNIISGRGAIDKNVQYITPLSYLGLIIENPNNIQKLAVVRGCLLDINTKKKVPGLFTPGLEGESTADSGANDEGFETFVALNGDQRQEFNIPIYVDEDVVREGNYLLSIEINDGINESIIATRPLHIIKKNYHALEIIILAFLLLLGGIYWLRRNFNRLLLKMQTNNLITITMFGVVSFVVVTLPANMIMGLFRVVLGPFSGLITGIFSDVTLAILTMSLIILVPKPGVITLFSIIRMLLSMLVFGHLTPIMFLSYGINAFVLEMLLIQTNSYLNLEKIESDPKIKAKLFYIAIFCSLAEMMSTYVGLQARSVLYRWYYAPWYVVMTVVINGFLYTLIGAKLGEKLGKILLKVRN